MILIRHMICKYLRLRQKHVQIVMHILFDHPPPKKKKHELESAQPKFPSIKLTNPPTRGARRHEEYLRSWLRRSLQAFGTLVLRRWYDVNPPWKVNGCKLKITQLKKEHHLNKTSHFFLGGFHVHFPGWNETYETWALDCQKKMP